MESQANLAVRNISATENGSGNTESDVTAISSRQEPTTMNNPLDALRFQPSGNLSTQKSLSASQQQQRGFDPCSSPVHSQCTSCCSPEVASNLSSSQNSSDYLSRESLQQIAASQEPDTKSLCAQEPKVVYLLLLLRFLPGLHVQLLRDGASYRKRWNASGELEDFRAYDVGFNTTIFYILQDGKRLEYALDVLNSLENITCETWNGSTTILIRHKLCLEIDQLSSSSTYIYWHEQAVIFGSCWFLDSAFTKDFNRIGILAVPYFQRVVSKFMGAKGRADLTAHLRNVIVHALLGSSRFSNITWKSQALDLIEELGEDRMDSSTRADIMHRRSFVLRTTGQLDKARQVIKEYFSNQECSAGSPRLNALHGYLIHPQAQISYELTEVSDALRILGSWRLFSTTACTNELCVLRKNVILSGMIKMNDGGYEKAITHFKGALETHSSLDVDHYRVLSYLSDTYCESGSHKRHLIF